MAEAIHSFKMDGYYGSLNGVFIADIALVNAAIGESVNFGEVLGKHSEVYGPLEVHEVTMITADPSLVKAFRDILHLAGKKHFGYNPLDYVNLGACGFCGDEYGIYQRRAYIAAQCQRCEETCCINCRKGHDCVVDEEDE